MINVQAKEKILKEFEEKWLTERWAKAFLHIDDINELVDQIEELTRRDEEKGMKKYKISDFIYWIEKYVDLEKEYTISQIANIIGKAMVDFFEDPETPY